MRTKLIIISEVILRALSLQQRPIKLSELMESNPGYIFVCHQHVGWRLVAMEDTMKEIFGYFNDGLQPR
jgi:hypothetical protein